MHPDFFMLSGRKIFCQMFTDHVCFAVTWSKYNQPTQRHLIYSDIVCHQICLSKSLLIDAIKLFIVAFVNWDGKNIDCLCNMEYRCSCGNSTGNRWRVDVILIRFWHNYNQLNIELFALRLAICSRLIGILLKILLSAGSDRLSSSL